MITSGTEDDLEANGGMQLNIKAISFGLQSTRSGSGRGRFFSCVQLRRTGSSRMQPEKVKVSVR